MYIHTYIHIHVYAYITYSDGGDATVNCCVGRLLISCICVYVCGKAVHFLYMYVCMYVCMYVLLFRKLLISRVYMYVYTPQ
jgi:hypothetical protein